MTIKRIVSFLPSATELLYELGAEDMLFGVTHECKFPPDAIQKPHVINSAVDSEKLTSREIDTITCQLLNDGKEIFKLNEENLIRANPDLIISQETCEVCAAHTNQVSKAMRILKKKPMLYSMDPHSVKEIIDSVIDLGKILGKKKKAIEIVDLLKTRIQKMQDTYKDTNPKILAIEWLDPFFTAGHWVPEMIEIAGGKNLISKTGEHSRRMSFKEITLHDPDIIILMPCGFDVQRTMSEYKSILAKKDSWTRLNAVKNHQVYAVDSNSFFSKPSIRTIEGIEILAKIIHPEKFKDIKVTKKSFLKID